MDIELIEKVAHLEERAKSNTRRIDKLEAEVSETKELTIAIKEIAMETKEMRKDLNNVDSRLKTVEDKPAKSWNNIKITVITSVITFLVGAFGNTIIELILK